MQWITGMPARRAASTSSLTAGSMALAAAASSGNAECSSPSRTVVVRDTLPPVITLHLRKNLIHTSQDGQKGLGGQLNPAGFKSENPFLKKAPTSVTQNSFMAEGSASSVNGWVLGAVASAVTGLALLSMSARKATTPIAV